MYEAPANAESQDSVKPHWVYYMQSCLALQEVIFGIRTCDPKVTWQQF